MSKEHFEPDPARPVASIFGSNVFNESVMHERLPKKIFQALRRTITHGEQLDSSLADVVANAMKDWAIEKGATHFTHWFQPMTGITAEKHDSFISPTPDGRTIMEFSGKELIKGEPDASSFPSGGLRATFEARGYTAWDCTSPAFVKQLGGSVTLYIPTVFCSYTGEALDNKTPLLKSMEAINKQALRVLKAFGNVTSRQVITTAGPEQEYFLIDKKFFEKRLDLYLTGRTLFGAPSPKGQEMEDHYFGSLKERIAVFMNEVNTELWKLGVSAKTQHNEVAPSQYELAPIFSDANLACDHNQLTMDSLHKVALRHGLVCLLHEKPFAGVNGSGKHNNWSLATDDGINLLDPGVTPHDNAQFLVFLFAVIRAIDTWADLLRATVAHSGNDHRLGANEAPPAIVSIFLGDQLTDIFEQVEAGGAKRSRKGEQLKIGVSTLPPLPKDTTDRNRTSPFAFTGNKFEFRMVGSSQSVASPNFVLNTIVADSLSEIAGELEKARDFNATVAEILARIAKQHKRIIFNGNNYSQEWVDEASKRGLSNIRSAVESLTCIKKREVFDLFVRHKVLTKTELSARIDIRLEAYTKQVTIEALAMIDMANRQILPAAFNFAGELSRSIVGVKAAGVPCPAQNERLEEVCHLIDSFKSHIGGVREALDKAEAKPTHAAHAEAVRDMVAPAMAALRADGDQLESVVDAKLWPLPTYAEMLFLS